MTCYLERITVDAEVQIIRTGAGFEIFIAEANQGVQLAGRSRPSSMHVLQPLLVGFEGAIHVMRLHFDAQQPPMHYLEWITVDWRKRSSWRRAISAHCPELSSFK